MVENPDNQKLFPKYEEELQSPILHDETMNRALDTVYRNTTGKTMILIIGIDESISLKNDTSLTILQVENVTPPTVSVSKTLLINQDGVIDIIMEQIDKHIAIIPKNNYYKVTKIDSGMGVSTLDSWIEVY